MCAFACSGTLAGTAGYSEQSNRKNEDDHYVSTSCCGWLLCMCVLVKNGSLTHGQGSWGELRGTAATQITALDTKKRQTIIKLHYWRQTEQKNSQLMHITAHLQPWVAVA